MPHPTIVLTLRPLPAWLLFGYCVAQSPSFTLALLLGALTPNPGEQGTGWPDGDLTWQFRQPAECICQPER